MTRTRVIQLENKIKFGDAVVASTITSAESDHVDAKPIKSKTAITKALSDHGLTYRNGMYVESVPIKTALHEMDDEFFFANSKIKED